MKTYICVYFGSLVLALLATPVVIWFAARLGIVKGPGIRDVHSRPVARIGGVAIFVSMMSLIAAVLFLDNGVGQRFLEIRPQVLAVLSGCSLMFAVGLVDDIAGMRVRYKLLGQIAAASIVCGSGITIDHISVGSLFTMDFGWFSWPLTILWIVAITNAVNLVDGLDGLAAGISAIACLVIVILSLAGGNVIMAVFMLALLGSLTGFLFFNFNPAKIFLGDCGSLFLGFTIAASSVACSVKSGAIVALALPVLALGIPIFDTVFSMLRRFLERRSMFSPDRSHFHHRLLDMGLHQKHVVIVAYAVTILMTALGMFMMLARGAEIMVIFLCVILLLLLVFRVAGSVRLRETIEGLKEKYAINSRAKEEIRNFEEVQLHFRNVKNFDQWWQASCLAADKLGFLDVKLSVKTRDGDQRDMQWEKQPSKTGRSMLVNVPVADRRKDSQLQMQVSVDSERSLESAGRRIALFSRLVEEYSVSAIKEGNRKANSD